MINCTVCVIFRITLLNISCRMCLNNLQPRTKCYDTLTLLCHQNSTHQTVLMADLFYLPLPYPFILKTRIIHLMVFNMSRNKLSDEQTFHQRNRVMSHVWSNLTKMCKVYFWGNKYFCFGSAESESVVRLWSVCFHFLLQTTPPTNHSGLGVPHQ